MRKLIHMTVMAMTLMAATAAHAPAAKAGVDDCTYIAQQLCKGIQDPNGNYYYPGGPGWVACVEDQKQYIAECEPRPGEPCQYPWSC